MRAKTLLTSFSILLSSLIVGLAAWQWHSIGLSAIFSEFLHISASQWIGAGVFTALSYGFSLLSDFWMLRSVPQLPRRDIF